MVEVKVDGMPATAESDTIQSDADTEKETVLENRIMIDIKVSNSLYIRRGNMSYTELLKLIKNLKVLC